MSVAKLFRRLVQPLLWWAYRIYNQSGHWHHINGLRLYTGPSVFHPRWFLTTKTLTTFALQKITAQSSVLELGAGNGLLALSCSRVGAKVTATDINPEAVSSIQKSASANGLTLTVLESDLFATIPPNKFDYIFVNPPYFPGAPTNNQERAFLCGQDHEYFQRFFTQWQSYAAQSETYLILTDACQLNIILDIAKGKKCRLQEVVRKANWGEIHLIYRLESSKETQ